MSNYISKFGYVLTKKNFSNDELVALKIKLRGIPLHEPGYQSPNIYNLYTETKNKLYIPKMYGLNNYGICKENTDYIGEYRNFDFDGTLFDAQKLPVDSLLDNLYNKGGGILSLPTGGGKTVSCLYAVAQLKKKTLIIVNKISLMNQWISEIKTFLPSSTIGIIQGKNSFDYDNDITISMLKSLSSINYPTHFFDKIGLVVVDECHNISTSTFSKALMKTSSKYTIGLSATPNRSDGCEYVFKWFLGDIVFKGDCSIVGLPPIINSLSLTSKNYKEIFSKNDKIQYTSMISDLITMDKRNILIFNIINFLLKSNRKILVLSDRRDHLNKIISCFDNVDFTYGLFIGGMKNVDLEYSKKCQVILATYQSFGEGISVKDLDSLILTTPKKFTGHLKNNIKKDSGKLEQIVGRIFRKEHIDKNPIIFDLHDNFSIYKNQSKGRNIFYKSHFKNAILNTIKINIDNDIIVDFNNINTKKTSDNFLSKSIESFIIEEDC